MAAEAGEGCLARKSQSERYSSAGLDRRRFLDLDGDSEGGRPSCSTSACASVYSRCSAASAESCAGRVSLNIAYWERGDNGAEVSVGEAPRAVLPGELSGDRQCSSVENDEMDEAEPLRPISGGARSRLTVVPGAEPLQMLRPSMLLLAALSKLASSKLSSVSETMRRPLIGTGARSAGG